MNKLILAAALGATTLAGAALAQTPDTDAPPPPRHMGMRGMGAGALMRADLNGDGVITRAEASAEADQRFAAMDANRDGTLTRDERRAAMEARRAERGAADAPPPPPRPARDGDRSGWDRGGRDQSQSEFRDRALRMFDRVDTNENGQVDKNEIEAARMLMRARMGGNDAPPPPPNDEQ